MNERVNEIWRKIKGLDGGTEVLRGSSSYPSYSLMVALADDVTMPLVEVFALTCLAPVSATYLSPLIAAHRTDADSHRQHLCDLTQALQTLLLRNPHPIPAASALFQSTKIHHSPFRPQRSPSSQPFTKPVPLVRLFSLNTRTRAPTAEMRSRHTCAHENRGSQGLSPVVN